MRLLRHFILLTCLAGGFAFAQTFPEKDRPIRIIVPFGAGSGNDLIARAYSRAINESVGVSAIVENRAGAEAVIGVEAVHQSAPDGYTILYGNISTHVLNAIMLDRIPYDPLRDFTPISSVSSASLVLNAGPSTNFQSVQELLKAARDNPGKYTFGSATTSTRLAMEMLQQNAQIKLLAVPYKAMSQAAAALAGGEIDILTTDLLTAQPFYKGGRMQPLGTTGSTRLEALPGVPTIREQGIQGYEFNAWSAMFVPAKTPPSVVNSLRKIFERARQSVYVKDVLKANSQLSLEIDAGSIQDLIRQDTEKWRAIVSKTKTTP